MEKDKTIIKLIENFKLKLNFDLLEVVDYWKADLCSIGIKKNNKLFYISTYRKKINKQAGYDFDLEIINQNQKDAIEVVKVGRNVSVKEVINNLKLYLEVDLL